MTTREGLEAELKTLHFTMTNQRHNECRYPIGIYMSEDIILRYNLDYEQFEKYYQRVCDDIELKDNIKYKLVGV